MKYTTTQADVETACEAAAEARMGYPTLPSNVNTMTSEGGDTLDYVAEDLETYLDDTRNHDLYETFECGMPVPQPVFDALIQWLKEGAMICEFPKKEATLAEFGKSVLSIITDGQFLSEATLGRVLGKAIELKLIKETPGGYVTQCHD